MNAHTAVHVRSQPTATRAVAVPGDGEPYVVVHAEAAVETLMRLPGCDEVKLRTTGEATLFLSEGDALRLASQLVQAARKVQPVPAKWEYAS